MKPPPSIKPNLENLKRHLQEIAQERNWQTSPHSLEKVQNYLKKEFLSYGFEVLEDPFPFSGRNFSNIIAQGPQFSQKTRLIIGAHFDSVSGSPGADDNASGIACLLETARIYAESQKTNDSVEFVAFNMEEYGMIGSRSYAKKLKKEGTRIAGMLSLEMVGYVSGKKNSQQLPFFLKPFFPNVGNFIGLVGNTRSQAILEKTKKIFKGVEGLPVESLALPANGLVFPATRLSDHSPFWDEGFPALLITDTSFYRNPYYHSQKDRIETLDLEFLAKVTEATARTAVLSIGSEKDGLNVKQ